MLITGFMKEEEASYGLRSPDAPCGEVMLEVDAYARTTKLDGTVRGMLVGVVKGRGYKYTLSLVLFPTVLAASGLSSVGGVGEYYIHTIP